MRVKGELAITPVRAWRIQLAGLRLTWMLILVVAIGAYILVGDAATPIGTRLLRIAVYAVAAFAAVGLVAAGLAWYAWRGKIGSVQHYEVNDRRVTVLDGADRKDVPWAEVTETRRNQTGWYLTTGGTLVPLPRAAFTVQDAAAVDALLVEQAAQAKRRAIARAEEARAARQARKAARREARRKD